MRYSVDRTWLKVTPYKRRENYKNVTAYRMVPPPQTYSDDRTSYFLLFKRALSPKILEILRPSLITIYIHYKGKRIHEKLLIQGKTGEILLIQGKTYSLHVYIYSQ